MDFIDDPLQVVSMATLILLMLLSSHHALALSVEACTEDDPFEDIELPTNCLLSAPADVDTLMRAALHHHRLWTSLAFVEEDLGFWVKPRSTTWFSKFLLQEYDDARWVQMFRMTKRSVFSLAQLLTPTLRKKDTRYRLAIPVPVRLACTLFKLSHGANLLICSEMFVVGRSTVSMMLRQVVHAINVVLRAEISWPRKERAVATAQEFQELCGLPGVLGAIDGTQFAISKLKSDAGDYYYFKSGAYSMNCQAVVDSSKRFLDLYVGMPGSTNDFRMLRRSTLFHHGQRNILWDNGLSFNGFSLYLLGDGGYPLLPWLMVPHRRGGGLPIAEALFNRRLSKGRSIVENAFALLKSSLRELQLKCELDIRFLPDVVTCCTILHNVLLKQSHEEVETLLEVLHREEEERNEQWVPALVEDAEENVNDDEVALEGCQKRRDLAVYLSLQRIVPM